MSRVELPRRDSGHGPAEGWRRVLTEHWLLAAVILLVIATLVVLRNLSSLGNESSSRWGVAVLLGIDALGVLALAAVTWMMQRTTRRLRAAEAATRAIVESAADGIFTFDDYLRIQSFNNASVRIFAIPADQACEQTVDALIGGESLERLRLFVEQELAEFHAGGGNPKLTGPVLTCEAIGCRSDNVTFPISLSVGVVRGGERPTFTAIVRDLTERKRIEAALETERFLFLSLTSSLPHAIYFKDRESRFIRINRSLMQSFSLTDPEQAVGKTDFDFFTEEHASQSRRDELELLRTGEPILSREEKETWPDGRETWVSTTKMQLKNDAGEVVGTFGISRDITEIMRARFVMQSAKETAESASRAKSEFLANVSHEIRTPMNGIIGMTELALETELQPEQREYLNLVKSSADSLLHIINDILDFSKIEAGKLELDPHDMLLRDTLGETLRILSQRADHKGLELAAHVAANVPDEVFADKARLRQIVVNLVGNAIKFTEHGEIVVDVSLTDAPEVISLSESTGILKLAPFDTQASATPLAPDEVELHFAVRDTGIGIPENKLDSIFNEFEQADGSTARKYGGTGLGLAISKRLVELMGGRIWVESKVGQGSTFHFIVRFGLTRHERPEDAPALAVNLEGVRVLVVDDNGTNRKILEELLVNWRMIPTLVPGGAEGLQALEAARKSDTPFTLILLDAHMPGMSGFEFAERVREHFGLLGCTLMMLTSGGQLADVARCRELGIAGYLVKPVTQSDLFDRMVSILTGVRPAEETSEKEARETAAPLITGLKILLAEDNPVNQKLALRLLDKRQAQVTVAFNGIAALRELEQDEFDLVLMDVQMPEMGGFEATQEIRRREQGTGRHIPIIAMTAHAMKGDRERCLAAGMDDYVSKPIQAQELFAALDRNAPAKPRLASAAPMPEGVRETPVSPAVTADCIDWNAALEAMGGDKELLEEIISVALAEIPNWLKALHQAIDHSDAALLKRTAHTVKGSLGQVGATSSCALAERLETFGTNNQFVDAPAVLAELEQDLMHRTCPALQSGLAAG